MNNYIISWWRDSGNPRNNDHLPNVIRADEFRVRKLCPESEGNVDLVIEFLVGGQPRFTFFKIPDAIVAESSNAVSE